MVSSTIVSIYDILGILQNSTKNYWPKCRPNEAYKTSNNFHKRPISCAEKKQFFPPQPPSAVVVEGSGTEERELSGAAVVVGVKDGVEVIVSRSLVVSWLISPIYGTIYNLLI